MHESAIRGNVSELMVAAILWERGFIVSAPCGESVKYDLVMDSGEGLYRVQVKTGRKKNGYVKFGCSSHHHDRISRGGVRQTIYTERDFDYFGVYCREMDKMWLIPVDVLDLTSTHQFIRWHYPTDDAGEFVYGPTYEVPTAGVFNETKGG